MKITMIVPNLPPTVCGVYDYTRKLAEHWPTSDKWTLVCSHEGYGWPGAGIRKIDRKGASLASTLSALEPDVVALQYTCYGYAENGIPKWLADGLELFKKRHHALIVVMFHELHYSGRFYSRAYWRNSKQREVVRRLCDVAHGVLTGVPTYQEEIKRISRCLAMFAPIPSNIDPVAQANFSADGPERIAVFGLRESRIRILRLYAEGVATFENYDLVMLGAGLKEGLSEQEADLIERLKPNKLEIHASTESEAVSRALASCQVLLCPYTAEEIPKSGTAMAALAHGLILVAPGKPLKDGPPFASAGRAAPGSPSIHLYGDAKDLAAMGRAGHKWYEENSGWPRAVAAWHAALTR